MRRLLATTLVLFFCCAVPAAAADKDKPKDSDKAAATRKAIMDTKISVNWKDDRIQDVAEELAKKLKEVGKADVKVELESKISGLTRNMKITLSAKNKTVGEILDEMGKKYDLGYIVVSGTYGAGKKPPAYPAAKYDGVLLITKGPERGYQPPDKK
jgi:hypothetical protein